MATLSLTDANLLVRKNLDEADPNGSIMFSDENGSSSDFTDNKSLDDIIKKTLPEAINAIHRVAPVALLDGESVSVSPSAVSGVTGAVEFTIASSNNFLRLVSFKASDSPIVITQPVEESSAEGRKQANPTIRGTWDRPRLVHVQGSMYAPKFVYYSLKPNESEQTYTCTIIKEQIYASDATGYTISAHLRQNIIDYLTALVLEIYSDQRAQNFFQRASIFS